MECKTSVTGESINGARPDIATYIMVKNTWRNKLTAFSNTDNKYSHASPDIIGVFVLERRRLAGKEFVYREFVEVVDGERGKKKKCRLGGSKTGPAGKEQICNGLGEVRAGGEGPGLAGG